MFCKRKIFDVYQNAVKIIEVKSRSEAQAIEKASKILDTDSRTLAACAYSTDYINREIVKANSVARWKRFGLSVVKWLILLEASLDHSGSLFFLNQELSQNQPYETIIMRLLTL